MEIELVASQDYGVICNVCGQSLKAELWEEEIVVDPCETCLEKEREDYNA